MGFKASTPTLQELSLAAHNRFAGAQDRILALLNVPHQLQRGTIPLFDVFLDVALGALLGKQFAIAVVEAQSGQIFFVHDHDELGTAFDEGDIRLDQPRIGAIESLARSAGSRLRMKSIAC